MKQQETALQKIEFGTEASDCYYCLVDLRVSPSGLNIKKMRLTDPRNIDLQFREAGCLMMFNGDEIEELIKRGDINAENVHKSLFRLAVAEGVIKKS